MSIFVLFPQMIEYVLEAAEPNLGLLRALARIKAFRPFVLTWWRSVQASRQTKKHNWETLKWFCQRPSNKGLYLACVRDDRELANLMIEKGATNFNWGLQGACFNGHREMFELMIEKGADDLNLRFRRSMFW